MKLSSWIALLSIGASALSLALVSTDADAKRLGGGKPAGMQRQAPPAQQATPTPAKPADAPGASNAAVPGAAGATGAAAAAGKRSWLGPVAGLAAGLGIAALASHFGMGEGLANIMTMLLVAGVAFFVIRWLMGRFAASRSQPALAGASAGVDAPMARSAYTGAAPDAVLAAAAASSAPVLAAASRAPEGFDVAAFERTAKLIFIRMQAANDAAQLDDLRKFTTPELFASLRLDLQERGSAPQHTDVQQLDAQVVDTAQENEQWIVSVRFYGLVQEAVGAAPERFDELWHLVKPLDGSREWAISGITPQIVAA